MLSVWGLVGEEEEEDTSETGVVGVVIMVEPTKNAEGGMSSDLW